MSQAREINPPNLWRLETPGHTGWERTARETLAVYRESV